MISRLAGILLEKNPPQIVIDIGGMGYDVDVPMSTFYNLPAVGETVALFTHLVVREDAHLLFGFLSESERACFRQLVKISGVGARTALAVLSGMSVQELAQAVVMQESGRLMKVPGIGKKTAERLLLELKDKLPKGSGATSPTGHATTTHEPAADILNALLALGYSEREAMAAMRQVPAESSVSDGIRFALRSLAKA